MLVVSQILMPGALGRFRGFRTLRHCETSTRTCLLLLYAVQAQRLVIRGDDEFVMSEAAIRVGLRVSGVCAWSEGFELGELQRDLKTFGSRV